jgi:hypothetical protein
VVLIWHGISIRHGWPPLQDYGVNFVLAGVLMLAVGVVGEITFIVAWWKSGNDERTK